jgi:uncharacterized membrane protein YidH (DUF202 family)
LNPGSEAKAAGSGLQHERTALAWSRTSFAALGNGALLFLRESHSYPGPLRYIPACLAVGVALLTYLVAVRRQRLLRRHLREDWATARREVRLVSAAVVGLIVATALMLPL